MGSLIFKNMTLWLITRFQDITHSQFTSIINYYQCPFRATINQCWTSWSHHETIICHHQPSRNQRQPSFSLSHVQPFLTLSSHQPLDALFLLVNTTNSLNISPTVIYHDWIIRWSIWNLIMNYYLLACQRSSSQHQALYTYSSLSWSQRMIWSIWFSWRTQLLHW